MFDIIFFIQITKLKLLFLIIIQFNDYFKLILKRRKLGVVYCYEIHNKLICNQPRLTFIKRNMLHTILQNNTIILQFQLYTNI